MYVCLHHALLYGYTIPYKLQPYHVHVLAPLESTNARAQTSSWYACLYSLGALVDTSWPNIFTHDTPSLACPYQVLVCGYRSSMEMLWHQVQGHGMGTHYVMLRAHLLRHYNGFEHPGDAVARYQVKVWIQRWGDGRGLQTSQGVLTGTRSWFVGQHLGSVW